MRELFVDGVCLVEGDHHWAVILQEKGVERYLPLFMCPEEAKTIAMKLQGGITARPSTHDLLCSVISNLGGSLLYVLISNDHVAGAKIGLQTPDGNDVKELYSCPSDAVTLAVHYHIPIYAQEGFLDEMGWAWDKGCNLFISMKRDEPLAPGSTSEVREGELARLSAFEEFVESLDLEDLGTQNR